MPRLTLYFIIQPPQYLYMACHLAASVRCHLPPDVELVGYCPAGMMDDMGDAPKEVLRRLRCRIEPLETEGVFSSDYPHGNKILAAVVPKTTDFAAFLDSDMAFLRPCDVSELVSDGQVGMVPSTSMRWADQSIWDDIYGAFDMPVPDERISMTRDKRHKVAPYFNAGLIVTDERYRTPDGKRFAEVWLETALELDRRSYIPNKRPYLDQMSLPVATLRAGMTWNILPERYNYSIGGILRGKPLPQDADVTLLHYRNRDVLGEAGRKKDLDQMLNQQLGTRLVRWIFDVPEDRALPLQYVPAPSEGDKHAIAVPDPSKAAMAALTIFDGDAENLTRWARYYADALGPESLYVLAPQDADVLPPLDRKINIIPMPKGTGTDALWDAMASMASGLTLYYNWVACLAPDEFLMVDPLRAPDLGVYLSQMTARGRVPRVTAPLGLAVEHPIGQGPVYARASNAVQKPCISRGRISYASEGAAGSVKAFAVDPHLCLIRLARDAGQEVDDSQAVVPDTPDLPELRQEMAVAKQQAPDGYWRIARDDDAQIIRLPARMRDQLRQIVTVDSQT